MGQPGMSQRGQVPSAGTGCTCSPAGDSPHHAYGTRLTNRNSRPAGIDAAWRASRSHDIGSLERAVNISRKHQLPHADTLQDREDHHVERTVASHVAHTSGSASTPASLLLASNR